MHDEETYRRLQRVDELDDYKVADHEADPRGWDVVASDGSKLGEVDHLIGDTGAMEVKYLTVEVDRGLLDEERHVLVPVEQVDLDRDEERVVVRGIDTTTVVTVPHYGGGSIDRDYDSRVRACYGS